MSLSPSDSPAFAPEATRVSGRRVLAHIVDGTIVSLLFIALVTAALQVSEAVAIVVLLLAVFVGQAAYFVLTQRRSGQSPGKRLSGIRVVDARGLVPGPAALVRRSLPLIFEYFYVIAFVAILSSEYRQRLGDRWAGTYVVRHATRSD